MRAARLPQWALQDRVQYDHHGILIASNLIPGLDRAARGAIEPIEGIGARFLPYYIGRPAIAQWEDQ